MKKFTFAIAAFAIIAFSSCSQNAATESTSATENINTSSSNSESENSIENTQKCLVDYDWVYPSGNNPSGAWKFASDGTFNSSTTAFGGMSTWGNWEIVSPGKINVSYTRTTEGTIPNDQILTLSGCNSLTVGSTTYVKD